MQSRRFEMWVVATFTVLVPLAFLRSVRDSFDLTKATLVNFSGILLAPFAVYELVTRLKARRVKVVGWTSLVFLALSAVSLVASRNRWMSFFGQYQRYTGLLTILCCAAVAAVIATRLSRDDVRRLSVVLVATQLVVNFYGWLQATNRDPWEWSAVSFGRLVFSSLGNPNTASAFSVITLPLAVRLISRTRDSKALGVLGMATFTSTIFMIPVYNSFQAYVGLVPLLVAMWLVLRDHDFSVGSYGVVATLAGVIVVLFSFTESTSVLLVLLAVATLIVIELTRLDPRLAAFARQVRLRLLRLTAVGAAGMAVVVIVLFDRIQSEIDNGLLERKYFYRAARDLWFDAPILGRGLESFGAYYTQYRPAEHAVTLEGSITSSVHSIPLGMFASGGILLGVAFLVLIGAVTGAGIRQSHRHQLDLQDVTPWFLTSLASFLVISLVSVESIHLYFLTALIIGGTLNAGSSAAEAAGSRRRGSRRASKSSPTVMYLTTASVVLALVTIPLTTRFFRADQAALDGMKAAVNQDAAGALSNFERAKDLAPWEPSFTVQLAQAYAANGSLELAAEEAIKAAELSNYVGSASPSLALIVLQAGRLAEGLEILERAIERDPFAPELKRSAADLFGQVADVEEEQGDLVSAESHRARSAELLAAVDES